MKTSEQGINFIKHFEGFRNKPYQDVVGKWTVGYGHLIKSGDGVVINDFITPVQATGLLKQDLVHAEDCVNNNVTISLSQNQFDALVSFVYNLGCGAFKSSTLLRKLNAGDSKGAAIEFPRWNKAGGAAYPGLTNRRIAEQKLFVLGEYPE